MTAPAKEDLPVHPIPDYVQNSMNNIHRFKESGAKEDAEFDISPIVTWFDGDCQEIATFLGQRVDKRDPICAAHLATGLLNAQHMVVHMDVHVSQQTTNPATGKEWVPGEMQKACDEDGACSTGVITDAIATMVFHRRPDGIGATGHMINRTYHVGKSTGDVHWQTVTSADETLDEKVRFSGRVVDGLRAAFEREAMTDERITQTALENPIEALSAVSDTQEEALELLRLHTRLAGMKMTALTVGGAMLPCFSEEIADKYGDIITHSFSEEALDYMRQSPAGLMIELTRDRFGLDIPIDEW